MQKDKEWLKNHAKEMQAASETSRKLLDAIIQGDANHNDWWEQCLKDSGKNAMTEKTLIFHALIPILAAIGMNAHKVLNTAHSSDG